MDHEFEAGNQLGLHNETLSKGGEGGGGDIDEEEGRGGGGKGGGAIAHRV